MIYGGTIITPANTLQAAPLKTVFACTSGMIYVVKLYFPPGSSGLLHVQVYDADFQIFPSTIGQSFSGDNIDFSFDETYDKSNPPYELVVRTWNTDTEYDHEFGLFIGFASKQEYISRYVPQQQVNDALLAAVSTQASTEASRKSMIEELLRQYTEEEK